MKDRELQNPTPITDHIDLPLHVASSQSWFNESLPVIKEEEEAKRKSNTDTGRHSQFCQKKLNEFFRVSKV